jgi:hypothetical protein
VSLFRRDKTGISRAHQLRGRARARLGRPPGVALEELECRVLLSTNSGNLNGPLYASELPIGPAILSPLQQSSNQFAAVRSSNAELRPDGGGLREPGLVFVHLHFPVTVTESPMLLVIGSHTTDGSSATNFADADQSMGSGVGVDVASFAQSGQLTPLTTFAGASSPDDDEGPSYATSIMSPPAPAVVTRSGAMGWVTIAPPNLEESTSFSAPPGGQSWPMITDVKRLDVTGTLDSDQTTMTFQIPVGPLTAALGLSLEEIGGSGGVMPALGQMELLNPNGTAIEEANPPPGAGPNMLQALTVLLRNATTNSRLQVQVVAAEPSSGVTVSTPGTESGTTTSAPSAGANFNVSFVLQVQRQDLASPAQDTGAASLGSSSIGTLIVAPTPQTGLSVASAGWTTDAAAEAPPSVDQVASTTVSVAATETVEQPADFFDGFNVRVLTGPLASRTASPLGPTLASIDAEATQEVDRHERAMSQEIEGLESLGGETSVAWRSEHLDQGSPANRPGSPAFSATYDGPVIDVPGNGGYPMKVTSQGRGYQTQVSALWATLPSFTDSETAVASSEQPRIPMSDLALGAAAVDRSSSDFSQVPNYVKAACGMLFGLMMTSGPLFPGLIGRIPRRVPRWIMRSRSPAQPVRSPSSRRFSPRKFSAWLRGRLSST